MPDKKDCMIIKILQKNSRTSLTKIASEIGLSIDSTKKRINKMIANNWFHPSIQVRPRNFGFKNIIDVKLKLQNYTPAEFDKLVSHLQAHPNVVELFFVAGEWDLSFVFIAKDAQDQGEFTLEIRRQFGKIINTWCESLTIKAYKFEEYDLSQLFR